ncbi:hypothetical protein NQ318_003789 [Aromia moschata]|uniref:28S ribosomal protein S22, mitochondrial n=1 Tax=Aromia moschata TaxID=1265417 RepID=A0AAV8YIK0_9CUCU|nr:hypothetical protein NQ318_003789 [Aromia moschata]
MALFRYFSKKSIFSNLLDKNSALTSVSAVYIRLLNYSPIKYEVQALLKTLTRVDLHKVYRKRKLGEKKLEDPEYKFMTDEELQKVMAKAKQKVDNMLQMPPIDSKRLIVVREPDGTLQEAEWDLKYIFPKKEGVSHPKLFEDVYLENLLNRQEYEFILDSACIQYEPDDPEYQRIVSIVYQHINDNNGFELLRSTRHFAFSWFGIKLLITYYFELIETVHIEEASKLVELYCKVHNVTINNSSDLKMLEDYIKKHSNKKGALELGLQAYKDLAKERDKLERGIKVAHGLHRTLCYELFSNFYGNANLGFSRASAKSHFFSDPTQTQDGKRFAIQLMAEYNFRSHLPAFKDAAAGTTFLARLVIREQVNSHALIALPPGVLEICNIYCQFKELVLRRETELRIIQLVYAYTYRIVTMEVECRQRVKTGAATLEQKLD